MMRIATNDVTLEVAVAGDASDPAVLLLHGWPDTHALWRHQVGALVEAGYRTIAPDLRGFGDSDKPEAVDAYGVLDLAADVTGVLDHLAIERAHVVGHDWGAALAMGARLIRVGPGRQPRRCVGRAPQGVS